MKFTIALGAGLLLATQAGATTLFREDFNAVSTGNYTSGERVGKFNVVANDVDVFGLPGTSYGCPTGAVAGNGCLDLNGNRNGRIASDMLAVIAGRTYTVTFGLAGNGEPFFPSSTSPYTLDVEFAGVTRSFEVAPLAANRVVSFDVTAAALTSSSLQFRSTSTNQPTYWGAILDDISIETAGAGAVPEPATWGLMIVGFGAIGTSLRRRSAGLMDRKWKVARR